MLGRNLVDVAEVVGKTRVRLDDLGWDSRSAEWSQRRATRPCSSQAVKVIGHDTKAEMVCVSRWGLDEWEWEQGDWAETEWEGGLKQADSRYRPRRARRPPSPCPSRL